LGLEVLSNMEILLQALEEILYFQALPQLAVVVAVLTLILKMVVLAVLVEAVVVDFLAALEHLGKVMLVELPFDKMVSIQLVLVAAVQAQ
jgi:hypothetical protein